jgi:hypothetical protein
MRVSLPPLDLVQLSGPGLRSLLDEAGMRWRVIVLSVCTPGPFISALADENTVVIANAPADADVGECAHRGEPVSFADTFFNESMPRSSSLTAAFENAKVRLSQAGPGGPSPVLHVGSAIAGRLESVRGRSGGVLALSRAARRRG